MPRPPAAVIRAVAALAPLALVGGAGAPAAGQGLGEEVLALVNRERAAAGADALTLSTELERAALTKAELVGREVESFPSLRPSQVTAMARLDDLPQHLSDAGFAARRASAHVVVADQVLTARDLVEREPALRADLLDPALRELGLGLVRQGALEIAVAIVARSKGTDFATSTAGLDDLEQTRSELLRLTNKARRGRNRVPLRRDRCLERAAQRYADRMLAEGFYGHVSPEGEDVAFRLRGGGCRRSHVGENLARGQTSVRQVIDGWMDSPGHRDNLLNPDYRRVGFGLALGPRADDYWIVWVQVLAAD